MAGKKCAKCEQPYSGFGDTCGACRKNKGAAQDSFKPDTESFVWGQTRWQQSTKAVVQTLGAFKGLAEPAAQAPSPRPGGATGFGGRRAAAERQAASGAAAGRSCPSASSTAGPPALVGRCYRVVHKLLVKREESPESPFACWIMVDAVVKVVALGKAPGRLQVEDHQGRQGWTSMRRKDGQEQLSLEPEGTSTSAGSAPPSPQKPRGGARRCAGRPLASGAGGARDPHAEAEDLMRERDFERAENVYRQAIGEREERLGEEHLETLSSVHGLGVCLGGLGRMAEAEELLRRALAGREAGLGRVHLDTCRTCHELATVLWQAGRAAEAEPLLKQALEGREAQLGEAHNKTMETQYMLGMVQAGCGSCKGSEKEASADGPGPNPQEGVLDASSGEL